MAAELFMCYNYTMSTYSSQVTGQRKLTAQEVSQLRNNPAMTQFMQRIQQTGVSGSPRTSKQSVNSPLLIMPHMNQVFELVIVL